MIEEYNIVIAGVGGQGVLTASKVLGLTALRKNMRVRVGEVHGLSQRYGSVVSYVRFGENVYGAMVPEGKGDVILSLEPVEALRNINYLKRGGIVLSNKKPIPPIQVLLGMASYPPIEEIKDIVERLYEGKIMLIDADRLAIEAGDIITLNIVMVGALAGLEGFPFSIDDIEETLDRLFAGHYAEINKRALRLGYKEIKKTID